MTTPTLSPTIRRAAFIVGDTITLLSLLLIIGGAIYLLEGGTSLLKAVLS